MKVSALSHYGALPDQTIRSMVEAGFIIGASEHNIAPASLDLTLSDECYHIEGVFQVQPGESVRELLSHIRAVPHALSEPLMVGEVYLARLHESAALPSDVYGYCNPKSSTGRLDLHVRVLADGVPRYDSLVPGGWKGELWIVIHPKSFSVLLSNNQALAQARFFTADTRFSALDLEIALARHQLLWSRATDTPLSLSELAASDHDGAPILTLAIDDHIAGWVSKSTDEVIDVSKIGIYDPASFFDAVELVDGYLRLERGKFYILSTDEAVRVPPVFACEMASMDDRFGDFRSHYAGFIDPGWGWGKDGSIHGRPITLEVRPFEDLVVRHGQPIAKIRFERMTQVPDALYDTRTSNYTVQSGPRLAKQFKVLQ